MTRDEGKQWLLELTQSITGQLKSNREDILLLWEAVREARTCHTACREQILAEIAKLDKRVEVILVRIGIYVAIATFLLTAVLQFVMKHFFNE